MEDYSKGKIYKIISDKSKLPYIGSTRLALEQRFKNHKRKFKCYKNGKKVTTTTAFKVLKYDDARIELIENYPCNSREELEKREGTYMIIGENCVNKQKAGSNGDYSDYQTNWHNNPETKKRQSENQKAPAIKAFRSEYIPCDECGQLFQRSNKVPHKNGRLHKLFLKDPKAHAIKMKEKEERKKLPKYLCVCGEELTDQSSVIKKHLKRYNCGLND